MVEKLATEDVLDAERRTERRRTIFMAIVFAVLVIGAFCNVPIWHRHPGPDGMMHGHAIWEWGHIH